MTPDIEKLTTKDDLIKQGFKPLSKLELLWLISNTTVCGDYEYSGHRIYKTYMSPNGDMVGKNDWGSTEYGKWSINNNGYLCVKWQGYWEDWCGVAFKIDNSVKFYDSVTGLWRTTFNNITQGKHSLEVKN